MNIPHLIEWAISLIFIFLLFSILLSSFNEFLMHIYRGRARFLKDTINEILNDSGLNKNYTELLYDHPQIDLMKKTQDELPAYISSEVFATALIDIMGREYEYANEKFVYNNQQAQLVKTATETDPYKKFLQGVELMRQSDLRILLKSLIIKSTDFASLQSTIENYFNDYMDRTSGWFKVKVQKRLFILGLAAAIFFNADCVRIAEFLWNEPAATARISEMADEYIKERTDSSTTPKQIADYIVQMDTTMNTLKKTGIPIGWESSNKHGWFYMILGWLLSAFAASRGSTFWFDLLSKAVNLRKTGIKPETTTKK